MINWMNNDKQSMEKDMIGQHFKNTFKYDVKSVSPQFANFLFFLVSWSMSRSISEQ